MDFDKAVNELIPREEEHAIIYISIDDEKPILPFRESFRRKKGCVDVVGAHIDSNGTKLSNCEADSIIRLCERCIDTNDVFIVHKNMINATMNIADEIALCYGLSFEFKDIPRNEDIRNMIRSQYTKIKNSPLYTMLPLEYCKRILEITFDQARQGLRGELEIYSGYFFFEYRQCNVMLKSGIRLCFHLETFVENFYLPDIDDIEYVQFGCNVPEILDQSSDEERERKYYYNLNDSRKNGYGICDHYGNDFGYNSIDGITIGRTPIPEKYKDYRTIQREYWEFYKGKAKTHIYPKIKDAYLGFVNAEKFIAERNGYLPMHTSLLKRNIKKLVRYRGGKFFDWLISVFEKKRI